MKHKENTRLITLESGRRLEYSEYGDHKGVPVMYFHGWPASRLSAGMYDELAQKLHIRIIAPDRPGYGYSDYYHNRTLLDWPNDVKELADVLKIRSFCVMGVSGGGPYAAVCAYSLPKRVTKTTIVAGLAPPYINGLLISIPLLVRIGWQNYSKYPILRRIVSIMHYGNALYGPSIGFHRIFFGSKADKRIYGDSNFRSFICKSYKESCKKGYKGIELDLKLYTQDWGINLKHISTPVYLYYGADDTNVSLAMGKYYNTKIPKSNLTIFPGEGHLISFTHAEEILKTFV